MIQYLIQQVFDIPKIANICVTNLLVGGNDQEVIDMINEYSKENNNVLQFLDNVNVIDRESSAVYDDYKYWCAENGVMNYKIRKFNAEIRSHTDLDLVIEKIGGKATQIWRKR